MSCFLVMWVDKDNFPLCFDIFFQNNFTMYSKWIFNIHEHCTLSDNTDHLNSLTWSLLSKTLTLLPQTDCYITGLWLHVDSSHRDMTPRHFSSQGQNPLIVYTASATRFTNAKLIRFCHYSGVWNDADDIRCFLSSATEISCFCRHPTTVISAARGARALRTFNKTKTQFSRQRQVGLSPLAPSEEIRVKKGRK